MGAHLYPKLWLARPSTQACAAGRVKQVRPRWFDYTSTSTCGATARIASGKEGVQAVVPAGSLKLMLYREGRYAWEELTGLSSVCVYAGAVGGWCVCGWVCSRCVCVCGRGLPDRRSCARLMQAASCISSPLPSTRQSCSEASSASRRVRYSSTSCPISKLGLPSRQSATSRYVRLRTHLALTNCPMPARSCMHTPLSLSLLSLSLSLSRSLALPLQA